MSSTSIARRFLLSAGLIAVILTLATSVVAFLAFQRELEARQVEFMSHYVTERVTREERQFSDLAVVHREAVTAFKRRYAGLTDAETLRLFDLYFPRKGDGTRRSRPDLFDGRVEPNGDVYYGIGSFLSREAAMTLDDKRAMVAGLAVTSRFGEAVHAFYDNFYFYTPETRMVMFAPKRDDRLLFYRQDAPADLDLAAEEMTKISRTAANPERKARCTDLQHLVSDHAGTRTGVACITPVDLDGRHIGAFGSSLQLEGYFSRAVGQTLPNAANLIVDREGRVIAYPGEGVGTIHESKLEHLEVVYQLTDTVAAIRAGGGASGVIKTPDGRQIIAYGRLRGPDWYFLVASPSSAVAWSAVRSAVWILVLGLIAAGLQTAAVLTLARRAVVTPLRRLAESADAERTARGDGRTVADLEARTDEIGFLAQALRSERERADEVLGSLEERVGERTAELEIAVQAKSRFLANMSHELRTPLNGVVAVSDLLAQRQTDPEGRELAQLIVASGRLLEQILTDILDVAKIEAGQMQLQAVPFDLAKMVRQIAELHGAAAETKGLNLTWSVAPDAAGVCTGDPVRLAQVLSNLLSNAVKFTERGGVTLSVERTTEGVRLSVSDTGIGFEEKTGERLFQRFEQADASITRRFGGTGLGLSICRSLVDLMGGTIEARSVVGEGSRFDVVVPLSPVGMAETAADERETGASGFEGLRVLLAEDHPTNQRVVELILGAVGAVIEIVPNGALALEALTTRHYDVVLMDMQMPEMDGLSATAAFRALELTEGRIRTPVIMLTANVLAEHVEASRRVGADMHVAKPLRPDVLLDAIGGVLAPARPETAAAA